MAMGVSRVNKRIRPLLNPTGDIYENQGNQRASTSTKQIQGMHHILPLHNTYIYHHPK